MASTPEFRPVSLLRRLATAEVDFVVIGGIAVAVHGDGRPTPVLEITYATDAQNIERLGGALLAVRTRLRGIADDAPFVPDAGTLRRAQWLTLNTDDGALDLHVGPDGAAPYPELRERAERIDLDGSEILVASLDDLLAMKRAAGRPQDLADIEALETARRLRGEGLR